jgi:uncharacterized protein
MSAGQILIIGVISFTVAAFLNSRTLLDMAERQPYGWQRTVLVGLATPLHTVSQWTGLAKPGETVDDIRNRNRGSEDSFDVLIADTTVPAAAGAPTTVPAVTETTVEGAATTAAAPTTAAPPSTAAPLRTPTGEAPLKMWVGGDSMAAEVGQALVRVAGETGVMSPTLDARVSTGLTRPDYFDWPAHLVNIVETQAPEVMVVMFGANDAQRMKLDNVVYDVSTPEWQAEYRRRVAAVMDFLSRDGRRVYWIGQPVMRAGDFDQKQIVLEGIYREEAALHPNVTFIHLRSMFAGPGGAYTAYLPDASGKEVLMRAQDGVHLSIAGSNRVGDHVLATIQADIAESASAASGS